MKEKDLENIEDSFLISKLKRIDVPDPGEEFWKDFPGKIRTQIAKNKRRKKYAYWGIPTFALSLACLVLLLTKWPTTELIPFEWQDQEDWVSLSDLDVLEMTNLYQNLIHEEFKNLPLNDEFLSGDEIVNEQDSYILLLADLDDELSEQEFNRILTDLERI